MWQFWQRGATLKELAGIEPRLASWDKHDKPSQVRLRDYLRDLRDRLGPLPEDGRLFLDLAIDVDDPVRILHHYDLENYLTPLFGKHWLSPSRFVLVSARKTVGGGSSLRVGLVDRSTIQQLSPDWQHLSVAAGSGSQTKAWKQRIHDALVAAGVALLPPGPVQVHLSWRCAPHRNWVSLWKPTGDAMGPVLGYASKTNPFHPHDDRIVQLDFHLLTNHDVGRNDVEVGMWWRNAVRDIQPRSQN